MQTILGAGGIIGIELAKELPKYTDQIRLVSRNPKKVNPSDELLSADLTIVDQVEKAVAGSEIVYLTVGYDYNIQVWREKWPVTMRYVIDACKKHRVKLVFFDNVYMYDRKYLGQMTEDTPIKASSKKGEVRTQIAQMLLNEVKSGQLTSLIARSADFYGPNNNTSILIESVYKNFVKGKKADWFCRADKIHTYTYTPDAGKATALLGNTESAYNQVWHLPTDRTPLTGKQWIELFAKEMHVSPQFRVLPNWMVRLLGLFIPILREVAEMNYQYDRDYLFDSSKFEKAFDFKITKPEEGVREIVKTQG
ncbi:MAG: NAD-dependent epimerase/dehydratase family protein [Microscillaceae bacterium]|nr:NAD-dependent epimerase/dehydratase family protein [Microscillaceae bacterium]